MVDDAVAIRVDEFCRAHVVAMAPAGSDEDIVVLIYIERSLTRSSARYNIRLTRQNLLVYAHRPGIPRPARPTRSRVQIATGIRMALRPALKIDLRTQHTINSRARQCFPQRVGHGRR